MSVSFYSLVALAGGRIGVFDVPCPLCAHMHNPRRRVLRIWHEDEGFIGYACARCGEKGWARSGDQARRPSPERLEDIRQEAAAREVTERAKGIRKSRWFWSRRQPVLGSPAETYLRRCRNYHGPIPPTLGYLPPSGNYPPAVIAAFGFADEPRPGALSIADENVLGVHLIKLLPDGRDRIRDDRGKITVGRGSKGIPIVLAPPNDLLGLVMAEGIENALSLHEGTGLGAWASGGAGRLPALAGAVRSWIDTVIVVADDDPNGLRNAEKLCADLTARGIHTEMRILGRWRAAA